MGWDGIYITEAHKTVSEKLSVYFKYHGFCENEVVKATIKNGVVYGAIRNLKRGLFTIVVKARTNKSANVRCPL